MPFEPTLPNESTGAIESTGALADASYQESSRLTYTNPPAESPQWHVRMSPYLWAAAISADAEVRGASVDGTADFGEILDNLDFAGMLQGEARNGRWMILGNAVYLDVSNEFGRGADFDFTSFIGEWAVAYQTLSGAMDAKRGWSMDLYGGNRYMYTEVAIRPLGGPKFDSDDSVLDLIFGTRFKLDLTDRIGLGVGGDIGGFDMGGSDLTWSAVAMVDFDINDKFRLVGGYRILEYEFDEGSGATETELDMSIYGPFLGVTILF